MGTGKGVFETTAAFGGENDSGRPFNIVELIIGMNSIRDRLADLVHSPAGQMRSSRLTPSHSRGKSAP